MGGMLLSSAYAIPGLHQVKSSYRTVITEQLKKVVFVDVIFIHIFRVVAKKMVSQLRFSLSQSPFFTRDCEQNLLPQSFAYEATKLCVYKMVYTERQHVKQVLKMGFYFNYFTCIS